MAYYKMSNGLTIMQCGPVPASEQAWYQHYPWIFIFIALAAAAAVVAIAW